VTAAGSNPLAVPPGPDHHLPVDTTDTTDTTDTALLRAAAELAIDYTATVDGRAVAPTAAALAGLSAFDEELTAAGRPAEETVRLLAGVGVMSPVAARLHEVTRR
jgi:hypothetical protein